MKNIFVVLFIFLISHAGSQTCVESNYHKKSSLGTNNNIVDSEEYLERTLFEMNAAENIITVNNQYDGVSIYYIDSVFYVDSTQLLSFITYDKYNDHFIFVFEVGRIYFITSYDYIIIYDVVNIYENTSLRKVLKRKNK